MPIKHQQGSLDAGSLCIAGFDDYEPDDQLLQALRSGRLGGVIWFKRNIESPEQVAEVNRRLHEATSHAPPMWIAVDQEGGRVQRLGPPVVQLPAMHALGSLGDPSLTLRAATLLGRQLYALGFNLNFAPVLDVWTNPANTVIGDRAFGSEPHVVVAHARAFMEGLAAGNVLSCPKHFPGHGDTTLDSHHALPRVTASRSRLQTVEMVPFIELLPLTRMLMTSHVVYDDIDPTSPATLSRTVLGEILREQLGYQGVIVSDDLEMKAVHAYGSIADRAIAAVDAGCDLVLVCSGYEPALEASEALTREAEKRPAFKARLRASLDRVRALRQAAVHSAATEPFDTLAKHALELQQTMHTLGLYS